MFLRTSAAAIPAICLSLCVGHGAEANPSIAFDAVTKSASLTDAKHTIAMHLQFDGHSRVDSLKVLGREVIVPRNGVCTAVKVKDVWHTTREGIASPRVKVEGDSLIVSDIQYGPADFGVSEKWVFTTTEDHIDWKITRMYHAAGVLQDTYFPGFDFVDMNTWTGGILDSGGVIWTKYIETPLATFANHTGSVTFWNKDAQDCLRIASSLSSGVKDVTARFSHQPGDIFTANFWPSTTELQPAHGLARYLADRLDVWQPTAIAAEAGHPLTVTNTVTLTALPYDTVSNLGTLKGIDGRAVRELLNTIGRYGVIDRGISGSNGWRTSFTCTHEPWIAEFGLALADPKFIANYALTLDEMQRVAITPEGRVLGRWHSDDGDAMPGTFDPKTGYYEAQWGYMLDSQPSYVVCVAEQFDLTGDLAWLRSHRDSCRAALEYMLKRDSDHDGLLEVIPRTHKEEKGSDWIDIVWASHENALVNAEMFEALNQWAGLEELMGDAGQAVKYRAAARKLKDEFNKPIAEGGFWNPDKKWYVYWREPDNSIHGDNFVTPVNFAAIAYGVCDDPERCAAILNQTETLMQKENLFHWPLCFFPFDPDDVYIRQKKFPVYENGDLFLGWAEMAVRAYAKTDPALAMKYIHKVIDRYNIDGLSFQRCLRGNAEGSGDDILANNAMAIIGLYRDIYGIRPRHDRLFLDPHLTPELIGTLLNYPLRDTKFTIELAVDRIKAAADGVSVSSAHPFGIDVAKGKLSYFAGIDQSAALTIVSTDHAGFDIVIDSWQDGPASKRTWTLQSGSGTPATIHHVVAGLAANTAFNVLRDGGVVADLRSTANGEIEFTISEVGKLTRLSVEPEAKK